MCTGDCAQCEKTKPLLVGTSSDCVSRVLRHGSLEQTQRGRNRWLLYLSLNTALEQSQTAKLVERKSVAGQSAKAVELHET